MHNYKSMGNTLVWSKHQKQTSIKQFEPVQQSVAPTIEKILFFIARYGSNWQYRQFILVKICKFLDAEGLVKRCCPTMSKYTGSGNPPLFACTCSCISWRKAWLLVESRLCILCLDFRQELSRKKKLTIFSDLATHRSP